MKEDSPRLEKYLRKLFGNDNLRVVPHPKKTDMAELMMSEEFLGAIYRDDEDGETSYAFQMAILDIDLDES